jgi:tetratricopeptide (TPR) repeat protein
VHARLLKREQPTRHVVFAGPHQWPPEDGFTAAVEWFEIQAMQRELRPRDPTQLAVLLDAATSAAQAYEARANPYAALEEYEQIARDFAGLIDLGEVTRAIERLRGDPAVRSGEKERQRWIRHEDRTRARLATQMRGMEAAVDDAARRVNDLRALRRKLEGIERDETSDDPNRADTAARLIAFVTTVGYERGIVAGQNGDYPRSALYYEIALQAAPESYGLRVRLAGAYVRLARIERALETLSEAVGLGFADADRLRSDENFEALRDDPRFVELLAGIESR